MQGKIITDFYEIDLEKHGVVEASAGTGKTFTITGLVSEIVKKGLSTAGQIVVVTFTEKAAGELRDRIKIGLANAIQTTKNIHEVERLKKAIERSDEMVIGTIHGFCNRLLSEFAFENGEQFQREIMDNNALMEKLFNKQIRKDWKNIYGDLLPFLLILCGFYSSAENFKALVKNIANKIYPFIPAQKENNYEGAASYLKLLPSPLSFQEMIETKQKMLKNMKTIFSDSLLERSCRELEAKAIVLSKNGATEKALKRNLLEPLLGWKKQYEKENDDRNNHICGYSSTNSEDPLSLNKEENILLEILLSFQKQLSEAKHKLENVTDENSATYSLFMRLKELYSDYERLSASMIFHSASQLVRDVRQAKRESGGISFHDMLILVYEALVQNQDFVKELQNRFRYALLDEFQDTDPIQWEIFKIIFLGNSINKLFLIGDPKQAIYRFRNADIYTYLQAKEEVCNQFGGDIYTLNCNYRSIPSLLKGFNFLFRQGDTSFFNNSKINYIDVESPGEEYLKYRNPQREKEKEAPLKVIFLNAAEKVSIEDHRKTFRDFLNEEILRILYGNRGRLEYKTEEGWKERKADAGDICILVRRIKDAVLLEEQLKNAGIPATIYKKSGIFQGEEAFHLLLVFDAILERSNREKLKKALLSDFFLYSIKEVERLDPEIFDKEIDIIFERLIYYASHSLWSHFFSELLYCAGVLCRAIKTNSIPIAERKVTNYQHITEQLETLAFRKKLNLEGLRTALYQMIYKISPIEEEGDLYRRESEKRKVQIMTIHVSKGLEFPIVFLYGALTQGSRGDDKYYVYHEKNQMVLDLLKQEKEKYLQEEEEEVYRLYYVAFTRAMCSVYVPVLHQEEKKIPAGSFLRKRLNKESIADKEFIEWMELSPSDEIQKQKTANFDKDLSPLPEDSNFDSSNISFFHFERGRFDRYFTIQSYSKITKSSHSTKINEFGEEAFAESDPPLEEDENKEKNFNKQGLPYGKNTGSMLHKILETIEFTEVRNKTLHKAAADPLSNLKTMAAEEEKKIKKRLLKEENFNKIIEIYLGSSPEKWDFYKETAADLIYQALNVELPDGIVLGNILPEDRLTEVEFYMATDDPNLCEINGFIDLVFRVNGKYYLLDWKSNALDHFSGKEFKNAVIKDYSVQYRLYMKAVKLWLQERLGEAFDYDKHFGGIFYLYLRGIRIGSSDGIFFMKPTKEEFEKESRSIEIEIRNRLAELNLLRDRPKDCVNLQTDVR